MTDNELSQRITATQEKLDGLQLRTTTLEPLVEATLRAIFAGTNDAIPLLRFKPDIPAQLMELAKNNANQVTNGNGAILYDYLGSEEKHTQSLIELRYSIALDFQDAAKNIFTKFRRLQVILAPGFYADTLAPGFYADTLAPVLHADASTCDYPREINSWMLISRSGALVTWAAKQEDLAKMNSAVIRDARYDFSPFNPDEKTLTKHEMLLTRREKALKTLRQEKVLNPLELDVVYLITTKTKCIPHSTGCMHASSPELPAHSTFIQTRVMLKNKWGVRS